MTNKFHLAEISDFQKIADSFLAMVDSLSVEVEAAKLKAIGSRNLLKSMAKKREAQQQQLQVKHMSCCEISFSGVRSLLRHLSRH